MSDEPFLVEAVNPEDVDEAKRVQALVTDRFHAYLSTEAGLRIWGEWMELLNRQVLTFGARPAPSREEIRRMAERFVEESEKELAAK